MLGSCDSCQQENDSFWSSRYELKALRCNSLKTDKQKEAWWGKTSEPLTRTEQVMVAGDFTFADISVSEGLLLARAFDLGCWCQALRSWPPVIHVGTSDTAKGESHAWAYLLDSEVQHTWYVFTFLLVKEIYLVSQQVLSGIEINNAIYLYIHRNILKRHFVYWVSDTVLECRIRNCNFWS